MKMQENIVDEREDLVDMLNQNFRQEKKKSIAVLPAMTSDYNKYITHTRNKLFLV